MLRDFFLVLLLNISSLIASETISETLNCSTSLGYQETSLKWSAKSDGETLCSQNFDHLNFLAFNFSLGTIQRNFLFDTKVSYAILGRGDLLEKTPLFSLNATTKGSTVSPLLELGYIIHLTPDHFNKLRLIPKMGYGATFIYYDVKNVTSNSANYENNLYQSLSLKTLRQTWYGFFLGGAFQLLAHDGFTIEGGYFYHFENLTHSFKSSWQSLSSSQSIDYRSKFNTHNGYSHDAYLKVGFAIVRRLSLEALMNYHYLFASKNPMRFLTNANSTDANFHSHQEIFQALFSVNWTF